jgi:zinc/manganese transport system ATP-binding protein
VKKSDVIISAKGLAVAYNGHSVWSDANFIVNKGEFIGLLGSNGAGKTTLFQVLLGLIKPAAGSLQLLNTSPRKGSTRVGYVPQKHPIDSDSRIDALEYVRLGLMGSGSGFSRPGRAAKERQAAMEALVLVDSEALAHRPISELSGGEVQRIFLAQALISKPDLLLLDEPLANLDIRRESQLVHLIGSIVKKQNVSVILIAHDINPLLTEIDRIIYIANGKVAAGKAEKVITSRGLSKLYNSPIEVIRDSKGRVAVFGTEGDTHHDG